MGWAIGFSRLANQFRRFPPIWGSSAHPAVFRPDSPLWAGISSYQVNKFIAEVLCLWQRDRKEIPIQTLRNIVKRFMSEEEGLETVEYAVIAGLTLVATIAAVVAEFQ